MSRPATVRAVRPRKPRLHATDAPGRNQATAALVFAHALPGSVEPGPDQSRSYAEWLSPRPGAESHA
jgi:hypothetical protein